MATPEMAVHAVLLAAGQSRRMGRQNKLLMEIGGQPMVRRVAERLLAAEPAGVVAVTGHEALQVQRALAGLKLRLVHNPEHAGGMAGSLRHGLRALPEDARGALIALADMPELTARDYRRLIEAFVAAGGEAAVRATASGRAGNPVILPRALFAAAMEIDGDQGARRLLAAGSAAIVEVEIGPAAATDVDRPDDLQAVLRDTGQGAARQD